MVRTIKKKDSELQGKIEELEKSISKKEKEQNRLNLANKSEKERLHKLREKLINPQEPAKYDKSKSDEQASKETYINIEREQIGIKAKYWRYSVSYYIYEYKGSDADVTFRAEVYVRDRKDRKKMELLLERSILAHIQTKRNKGTEQLFLSSNITGSEEEQIGENDIKFKPVINKVYFNIDYNGSEYD